MVDLAVLVLLAGWWWLRRRRRRARADRTVVAERLADVADHEPDDEVGECRHHPSAAGFQPRTVDLVVTLEWHEVGVGIWCDRCMLPSAVRFVLVRASTLRHVIASDTLRPLVVECCFDCGAVHRPDEGT